MKPKVKPITACVICGKPATEPYDERYPDTYTCDSIACGLKIQAGIDFIEECGDR
jgi:hypothetical protein